MFLLFRVRKQIACEEKSLIRNSDAGTIAILDTGVGKHPDLTGRLIDFRDFVGGKNVMYDDSGHGTHVCGIACGDGTLSEGKYRGISPFSRFVVGKVLDSNGDGTVEAMIEGIKWVLSIRTKYNIQILNVSVGIGRLEDKEKERALCRWLETAWDTGLVVVCAAGNGGPAQRTISPLGESSKVITVGCHDGEFYKDKADRCESYSGRGSLIDTIRKPDIVAPGTEIISCNVKCRKNFGGYAYAYTSKSGTSMATPIVSGALALLVQKYPEYTNEMVKRKLQYTAEDLKEPWYMQGWGMVNVKRLLE